MGLGKVKFYRPKGDESGHITIFDILMFVILIVVSVFIALYSRDADAATLNVCWVNPTENVGGTPLTDLAFVRVYYGISSRAYTDSFDHPTTTAGANNVCVDLTVPLGTYYVAATANNTDGDESAYSNEVVKTATATPAAPYVFAAATQPGATVIPNLTLVIGETGVPVTFAWSGPGGTTEVELIEHDASVATIRGLFNASSSWEFTPRRAGLFVLRLRNCNPYPDCGPWTRSDEQGYIYFFKLAAPSGGVIE